MSIFFAALVSFISFMFIMQHFSGGTLRKLVGYMWIPDLTVHGTIISIFLGTSTMGLIQAEAAAIMFSLWLRWYKHAYGYEKLTLRGWVRHSGLFTRAVS